jgi:hypothetical protein
MPADRNLQRALLLCVEIAEIDFTAFATVHLLAERANSSQLQTDYLSALVLSATVLGFGFLFMVMLLEWYSWIQESARVPESDENQRPAKGRICCVWKLKPDGG